MCPARRRSPIGSSNSDDYPFRFPADEIPGVALSIVHVDAVGGRARIAAENRCAIASYAGNFEIDND